MIFLQQMNPNDHMLVGSGGGHCDFRYRMIEDQRETTAGESNVKVEKKSFCNKIYKWKWLISLRSHRGSKLYVKTASTKALVL